MAVSAAYSVDRVVDAISNADTYIYTAAVTGNYEIVDMVIDAELALKQADLTDKQDEVLYFRWVLGWTQEEVAAVFEISQPRVSQMEDDALERIALVLAAWSREYDI